MNIQELETYIKDQRKAADLRDAILKLFKNPEYRTVFEEGFMLHEAARNVRIASDPSLDKAGRDDALAMGMAAGHVQRYLTSNVQMGNLAHSNIVEAEKQLAELRSTGDDE